MKLSGAVVSLLVAALVSGLALPAGAAAPPPPGGRGPAADAEEGDDLPPPGKLRKVVERRIRTMRALFLTEALDLTDDEARKLFALMDEFDTRREKIRAERRAVVKELRGLVRASPPPRDRINALLDRAIKTRLAEESLNAEMFGRTKSVLPAEKRARLLVAIPKFYRRVRHIIRKAREEMLGRAVEEGWEGAAW
jgi:Spy/CpxP family protein refolding chaperone